MGLPTDDHLARTEGTEAAERTGDVTSHFQLHASYFNMRDHPIQFGD